MAWIDDRLWCHPKLVGVSDKAKVAYMFGIAYSSGMSTRGYLEPAMQRLVGATPSVRAELVRAELWDENGDGKSVVIHDWDEHNQKRDDKRAYDRERKRRERDLDPDSWVVRSGQWQHTRRQVFERDNGVCVDCGKRSQQWHADHVPSRAELRERGDDPFDIAFIQTRCARCHSRRHILERTTKARTDART